MRSMLAVCLVVACGGSQPTDHPPAQPPPAPANIAVDTEHVQPATEQELAREQAIEQARAAGILGSNETDVQNKPGGPQVSVGAPPPPAASGRDKASIRAAVLEQMRQIRACYESRLLEDSSLTGTTLVQLVIEPDGAVTSSIGGGFDPKVDACVAKVLEGIKFPPSSVRTNVNYPFTFHTAS